MANPLAALGNILQGKQPDATACKDIFEAVQNDDAHGVEHFLSRGGRINELNGDGWSPVQMACWYDSMKALGALLKWNPDLRLKDSADRTAVHLAAFNGSERCLRRVLHAGAEVDARDKYGLTALHKASVAGQLSSIRTLLEYKADATLATADGLTAMHLAAWKGQREALRLLASGHADVNAASNDGGTALHESVRSGDKACVELLLQMGANPAAADRFGRTPADLAFAAGNRTVFAMLHEATQKAAASAAASAAVDTSDIPDPSEFWQYLQTQSTAPPAAAPDAAQAPLKPSAAAQSTVETHPRKQFEAWLGGILFPQRQRASKPTTGSGSRPYGTVNESAKPPPSLAAPAFSQMRKAQGGSVPAHKVGHVGGSQFAAHKAQAQSAPQVQADAPVENIQLTLDPYEDEGPPEMAQASAGGVQMGQGQQVPENPLAAMMQAIGKKAQKDIKTTMDGVASMVSTIPPPNTQQKKTGAAGAGGKVATMGDDEAYDSDEYDEAVLEKAEDGAHADGEDWGEFEDEEDDWGTSSGAAFKAKKRAQRAAAAEGRIYTMQEAREKLDQLDAATAAAQGWLRGRSAYQRLAAMNTFASAYPKVPQPGQASADEERVKAANPFAILTQGLWQAKPDKQEEERLAVQAHLQTATAAATIAAQAAGDTPNPIPLINFRDAWKATEGFSASSLLLEDVFGKVYRADILGNTHALRVLDSSLYDPAGLAQYLDAAAQIDHAHIVRVKGAAPDRGMLVLDLPESGNLLYVLQTAVLPTTEQLGWNGCVEIALAVASALQHLHNRPVPMAHGRLNAAAVYFDRNATAKVGDAGLEALCGSESVASGKLMARDLHSLGEIMMQLLTLNTQPIDEGMRKSILDFADSGKHIMPSSALSWPTSTAETFEAVAIACMRAGDAEDTAKALNEGIVPALQNMRGETLQSMWKQSGTAAKKRADGSYIVPSAYRCPLTGELMLDPVRAADGFVYERSAIEQWLSLGRKVSPMTNMPLSHPYVTPDRDLRAAVQSWLQSQNGAIAPMPA
eukprot:jgi/Ulvmu1/4566/UM002_0294.1